MVTDPFPSQPNSPITSPTFAFPLEPVDWFRPQKQTRLSRTEQYRLVTDTGYMPWDHQSSRLCL